MGTMQTETKLLMDLIGFPDSSQRLTYDVREADVVSLLSPAIENKIEMIYSEKAANLFKNSKILENLRQSYFKRSQSVLALIGEMSKILAHNQLEYAVFKTIRPFPFVTVDIDILFFSQKEFFQAYRVLNRSYKVAGYGPHSISLHDQKRDIILDLHSEIAVSRMIYIKKDLLRKYAIESKVDGIQTSVLDSPAAVLTLVAHALYKEQTITLSDYYSIMLLMLNMTAQQCRDMVELADQTHTSPSLKVALDLLYTVGAGKRLSIVKETSQTINLSEIEKKAADLALSQTQKIRFPFIYNPASVALAFAAKMFGDPLMRSTFAHQTAEILTNAPELTKNVLLHFKG
jgi:hypothetical protein